MLIFDENADTIIIESIHTPLVSEYMYVLDLSIMDYTLAPITTIEEIVCPTLTLNIDNFIFSMPAYWNVLVYDTDTYQLDMVSLEDATGNFFMGFVYGMNESAPGGIPLKIVNYDTIGINYSPALNKHQMLCHPISENLWINFSSADMYNKYLKNKVIGDLL